jgi:hypothetical protein
MPFLKKQLLLSQKLLTVEYRIVNICCMSAESITSEVVITRPDTFGECRTCPSAGAAVGRALGENLTHYHGKYPFSPESVRIECSESGGRAQFVDDRQVDSPGVTMAISVVGEVEFTNRDDSGRIQKRTHRLSYGVDCPHHHIIKTTETAMRWHDGEC